jgi:F-type H+-transporting ATPase subunit epsilon
MEATLMNLKILLPFRIFSETKNVTRIVIETSEGSYGFLPQRLDCVAALVPGILTYETENGGIHYLAIDEGVLIKAGMEVMASVRNAFDGKDLGKLHELIEKQFMNLDEKEKNVRSVMTKMESGFIQRLEKFSKE